jgi:hypothetical protein
LYETLKAVCCLDDMEEDGVDLACAGEATYGEWLCVKGLESEVDDRGVDAWWN